MEKKYCSLTFDDGPAYNRRTVKKRADRVVLGSSK